MSVVLPERFALRPHAAGADVGVCALECVLAREVVRGAGGWRLRYALRGDVGRLALPAPSAAPQARDGLWRHTCFEAFAARPDEAGYWEFNFSPSGDWAAYAFAGERVRCEGAFVLPAPPRTQCQRAAPDALQLEVWLPDWVAPQGAWQWGISAVLEDAQGALAYWALHHAKGQPDFHDRAGWRALFEV